MDLGRLSEFLKRNLGNEVGSIRTPEDFDKKIRGGQMLRDIKEQFGDSVEKINNLWKKTYGKKMTINLNLPDKVAESLGWTPGIPYPAANMTEATHVINAIEDTGWDMSGRAKDTKAGEQARMFAV